MGLDGTYVALGWYAVAIVGERVGGEGLVGGREVYTGGGPRAGMMDGRAWKGSGDPSYRGFNRFAQSGMAMRSAKESWSKTRLDSQIYLSNCGMGGRIARPGQRFSDAGPLTLLAALSTGNHVIPVRRR